MTAGAGAGALRGGVTGSAAARAGHAAQSIERGSPGRVASLLLLAGTVLLWFLPIEPAPSDLVFAGGIVASGAALLLGTATLALPAGARLVLLFALVQLLPAAWAAEPAPSWFYGVVTAFLAVVAMLLAGIAPLRTARAYAIAAGIAGSIVLLLFVLQVAGLPVVALDQAYRALAGVSVTGVDAVVPGLFFGDRPKGFFKDPNVVGAFLATATLWPATRLLLATRARDARRHALFALLLAAATAATLSRAAVLGITAGGVVLLAGLAVAGRLATRRVALLFVGGGALALLAVVAVIAGEGAGGRFVQLNPYDFDRAATWWRGVQAFAARPQGHGPGMFLLATTSGGFGEPYAAHSTWVRLLVENGLAGFATFLAAVSAAVWPLLVVVRRAGRMRVGADGAATAGAASGAAATGGAATGTVATGTAATADAASGASRTSAAPEDDVRLALALWCGAALAATLLESFVIDTLHWRHLWVLVGIAFAVGTRSPVPGTRPLR